MSVSDRTLAQDALAHLRKESLDIFNRVRSIEEDVKFVAEVRTAYAVFPIIPNLRCGAWYVDPALASQTGAYFKSTDGHFGNWSFNLRRPNLHLLPVIAHSGGIVLVDSTRAGKRMPDALSKTVPIWCAVVNRAISIRSKQDTLWDMGLYCPPAAVSQQEKSQIETKLDAWAESLASSSYELPELPKPLRPLWITPSNYVFPSIPSFSERDFLPIICVSASKHIQDSLERRSNGFSYVQGSGDDHELWGMGLTPQLFWQHRETILAADRSALPSLVSSIVSSTAQHEQQASWTKPPTAISRIDGLLRIGTISQVPAHLPEQIPDSAQDTAYVVISPSNPEPAEESSKVEQNHVLKLSMPEGKKGQTILLQTVLPRAVPFIAAKLSEGRQICICCNNGKDASVGVALAALQLCFDDAGKLLAMSEDHSPAATKQSIATRLQWIITSRPEANPSRATLKRVNEFLLSPPAFWSQHRPS
ncbi:hypothetical protein CERSUDRAFT_98945 [Gelatoporia subvermispora B]|uniref:Initiator tRNA phosphoribosyl transferase n=1 Tax=Ceriporiopsis subvermispora (strain B) TaxID=914234 RepID=M2Q805_CERS8|nr:hypothetical protein CERSUDRAFT_98945 [Gelatoporia subvermispora B]